MRFLFRTNYRSFYLLNVTQFLGALNDNVFKLLVIYLLINVQGSADASRILAMAGAIFVIPFLLFSSAAGVLADKISKRTIIVAMKAAEALIMGISILAIYSQSAAACYWLLFLMAAQSAVFGPSKYGIIPEIVESRKISKANGLLTSFTYLAIIAGTFLASFLADITHKNFIIMAGFCFLVALTGFLTSIGIKKTDPRKTKKRIHPVFFYEIYRTLVLSKNYPHLLMAICGSSFFLLIGSFTQLNIIPFAIESLGLSEVGGGYLFLATAVGIAIGSVIAGRLGKEKIELSYSCLASFAISIMCFLLWLFSSSLVIVVLILIIVGVLGGIMIVPFDSFIQIKSPDEKRGQVIAASNFLSFCGVLISAFLIYLIGDKLDFKAASGFALMGIFTFIFTYILIGNISEMFFPFFTKKILLKKYLLRIPKGTPTSDSIFILRKKRFLGLCFLHAFFPRIQVLILDRYFHVFPWFNGIFNSLKIIPPDRNPEKSLHDIFLKTKELREKGEIVCLVFPHHYSDELIHTAYKNIFGSLHSKVVYLSVSKEKRHKTVLQRIVKKRVVLLDLKKHIMDQQT